MKFRDGQNFLFGTLRGRLILGVAIVHAIMMTLFIIDLTARQRTMLLDRQAEEATALARSFATSAAVWIASDDLAGLQELVETQRRYPELIFAMLTDKDGRILAHTDISKKGQFLQDLPKEARETMLSKTPVLADTAVPSLLAGRHVGWARVGIGQRAAQKKLADIVFNGTLYALAAIVIGSFIAWLMGRNITRRLYAVQNTIKKVRKGDRTARSAITGEDEAASIASEFNALLDALDERNAALVQSETNYRLLLRNIRAGIIVYGPDTRIIMSNPMAQELLGLSEEQLHGKAAIDPAWHFVREDGSVMPLPEYPVNRTFADRRPHKDLIVGVRQSDQAAITWTLVNTEPTLSGQGEINEVIVTFVNITERKRTDELFRIFKRDPVHGAPSFAEHPELYHPEDMAKLTSAVEAAVSQGTSYELELRAVRTDGETRVCLARGHAEMAPSGRAIHLFGSLQDITERKQVEEALRKREAALNDSQRLAHIGSWDWDAVNDIIWWSDEYYRIYGFELHTPPPKYEEHRKAYTPEGGARLDAVVKRAMATGEPYEVDLELAQPTPDTRWIVARGEVKRDASGKIWGLRGTAQNITERKNAEQEIRRSKDELEQRFGERSLDLQKKNAEIQESQAALMNIVEDLNGKTTELELANAKLQELDRLKSMFIASMSHELRTPLNSIIGFSSIMWNEWTGPLTSEQKDNLAAIMRSGKHLLALINDVIDVSKIEAGKLELIAEDFDVYDVVAEAIQAFIPDIRKKDLVVDNRTIHQPMHTDRRRLLQCMMNLVSNAVKYTDKGSIRVGIELTDEGRSLEFSVIDTGIGMKPEDVQKLFSPFVRIISPLRPVIPGTGLGLYLTKKLAQEILGGDILVTSVYGEGSRFVLKVPMR